MRVRVRLVRVRAKVVSATVQPHQIRKGIGIEETSSMLNTIRNSIENAKFRMQSYFFDEFSFNTRQCRKFELSFQSA